MLLKSCLACIYHELVIECEEQTSRCSRENCYCCYTKCVGQKALAKFLQDESLQLDPSRATPARVPHLE